MAKRKRTTPTTTPTTVDKDDSTVITPPRPTADMLPEVAYTTAAYKSGLALERALALLDQEVE